MSQSLSNMIGATHLYMFFIFSVVTLLCTGVAASKAKSIIKTKSQIMCEQYAESVFEIIDSPLTFVGAPQEKEDLCGTTEEPLIVGGELAKPKEFPHMALIGYGEDGEDVYWLCGGSLISEQFILSAAHCADAEERGLAKWATVGDLKVLDESDDADPVTTKISERIIHPEYKKGLVYYDISLFKLETPVTLSAYIRPACLHVTSEVPKTLMATGWGHTSWKGSPTQDLMKVTLELIGVTKCNNSYRSKRNITKGILNESMVCAGGKEGKDTCQGDSGGPLQYLLKEPYCMYSVVGITSFGAECAYGKPGVYTRVSHYLPWIESTVWPNST